MYMQLLMAIGWELEVLHLSFPLPLYNRWMRVTFQSSGVSPNHAHVQNTEEGSVASVAQSLEGLIENAILSTCFSTLQAMQSVLQL